MPTNCPACQASKGRLPFMPEMPPWARRPAHAAGAISSRRPLARGFRRRVPPARALRVLGPPGAPVRTKAAAEDPAGAQGRWLAMGPGGAVLVRAEPHRRPTPGHHYRDADRLVSARPPVVHRQRNHEPRRAEPSGERVAQTAMGSVAHPRNMSVRTTSTAEGAATGPGPAKCTASEEQIVALAA